jgi:hypothetical protein
LGIWFSFRDKYRAPGGLRSFKLETHRHQCDTDGPFLTYHRWKGQKNSERLGTSLWKMMAGERVKLQYFINVVAAFTVVIRKSGADSGDCTNMHSLITRDFPVYDVVAIACTFLVLDIIERDRHPRSNIAAMDFKILKHV